MRASQSLFTSPLAGEVDREAVGRGVNDTHRIVAYPPP